jgi:hypothetical protein
MQQTDQTLIRQFCKQIIKIPDYQNPYTFNIDEYKELAKFPNSIKNAWSILYGNENVEFHNWLFILRAFQNDIWLYPVLLFAHNGMNLVKKQTIIYKLNNKTIKNGCRLMQNITRYLYSKGFEDSIPSPSIKDEMNKVANCVLQNKQYNPIINLNANFYNKLNGNIEPRFQKGLCAIAEMWLQKALIKLKYTDDKICTKQLKQIETFFDGAITEYIAPKQWKQQRKPTPQSAEERLKTIRNTLGNIVLLEKSPITTDKNEWIGHSRLYNSKFYTAKEISGNLIWWSKVWEMQQENIVRRIVWFLEGKEGKAIKQAITA